MFSAEHDGLGIREPQRPLPIDFRAVAGIEGFGNAGFEVRSAFACVGEAQRLIEKATKRDQMRSTASVVFTGTTAALVGRGETWKGAEIIASGPQMSVRVARDQSEVEALRDIEPELGGQCQIVVIVIVAAFRRLQQIQRSNRRRGCTEVLDVRAVVELVG